MLGSMTRHSLETAVVVVLLAALFGFVSLAMNPETDPSGRSAMVLAWLGISGWRIYERELRST
jgi:hypothetical protein